MIALLAATLGAQAQPFAGYQTNAVNQAYLVVRWQGRTTLGFGVQRRFSGSPTFTSVEAEWHFPLATMWRFSDHEVIVGAYKPLIARRTSVGVGLHARITRVTDGDRKVLRLGIAATALPYWVYAQSLSDGVAGDVGARATYVAVLASRTATPEGASWTAVPAHRVELGGHATFHVERTFGLAVNPYATRTWAKEGEALPGEETWRAEGDLTVGAAYHLGRL